MANLWMPALISLFGTASVLVGTRALVVPDDYRVELPLVGVLRRKRLFYQAQGPVFRALYDVLRFYVYHLEPLYRWKRFQPVREGLEARLARAGFPAGFTTEEYFALVAACATLGAAVGTWFSWGLSGLPQPLVVLAFGSAAAFLPALWLSDRERTRLKVINRAVPYVLDLLTLALSAGLDFVHALQLVVESRPEREPMREELELLLHEISMGKTRRDALLAFRARVNAPNVGDVVSGIVQAERMGTPMAQTLRVHASSMRIKRTQRAEKAAGQAAVKMLGPMVLLVGAVMLTVFGSLIVQIMRGGFGE